VYKRKLIEVSLPLEVINRESAREKSIRHGHPSTLHLWWARRPLAAARAVLFAQLVDDPSAHPESFPTESDQRRERERLHGLIEQLVVWENAQNEGVLAAARSEILKSCEGHLPPILDPFAGGGTIPLEAQRLGLEAHASDLNPVAVLINKALVEIPPRFHNRLPVFPGLSESRIGGWPGATGLAADVPADVRAYGAWMRTEAATKIGELYPRVRLDSGAEATAIAWLWARTVICSNPACAAEVPLVSSLDLSKKKGREQWLRPRVGSGRVEFEVAAGPRTSEPNKTGQGARFTCWICKSPQTPDSIHQQLDQPEKPLPRLLCVVAEGNRERHYVTADKSHIIAAQARRGDAMKIRRNDDALLAGARGTFGGNAQGKRYGFFTFGDYFTDRQLIALTTFSDLVPDVRERILLDAANTGQGEGQRLEAGGNGAAAYADAVAVYLGLAMSRSTDYFSSLNTWSSSGEFVRNVFARQALAMSWDFVETNPFSSSSGNIQGQIEWTALSLAGVPATPEAVVTQQDAAARSYSGAVLSTDPPYYDNIVYSDLADYFYVWQRRSLRSIMPELFATMLVPKAEELVANSYRHPGRGAAKAFFERGFQDVFARARDGASAEFPITVYYAFKQSEADEAGEASSGWETLLEGMIRSGWSISATWPLRSERAGRMVSIGTNALASAIVLAMRPRDPSASVIDRRGLIAVLQGELPDALRRLQQGAIAPVDLPQAAIGPGMAVFSRYARVVEADGSAMTVRSALARINEILDQVLNEQEGDFDPTTRFAIAWYRQHGYKAGTFGDADNLARARNTAVEGLDRDEVLSSRAGKVKLFAPAEVRTAYDVLADEHTSAWEALHHLIRILEADGVEAAGSFLRAATSRPDGAVDADLVKELAFLLFSLAEKSGWTQDALSFNTVATSWPEILDAMRASADNERRGRVEQGTIDFEQGDD